MINVARLEPGTRLRLKGGITAAVVENPEDGMWVMIRYITVPDDPAAAGTEDLCHADQILEVLGDAA